LSLCHHRGQQYIDATYKSSWKDSQKKWFLMDMHVQPQWVNKLLFLPFVKDKWGEPVMMPRLAALIKQVVELHEPREAGLRMPTVSRSKPRAHHW
jgi:hypothetical protein